MTDTARNHPPKPTTKTTNATIRRFAHELYPSAEEWEVRPLEVEVPYLFARVIGLSTWETGFLDADAREQVARVEELVLTTDLALLTDALQQGLTGDEAWRYAQVGGDGQAANEKAYERAVHYGIPVGRIKPYPIGPDPITHNHKSSTGDVTGSGLVTVIDMPEDQCPTCCEPEEDAS